MGGDGAERANRGEDPDLGRPELIRAIADFYLLAAICARQVQVVRGHGRRPICYRRLGFKRENRAKAVSDASRQTRGASQVKSEGGYRGSRARGPGSPGDVASQ